MWRMSTGDPKDRVLTPAERRLFREGVLAIYEDRRDDWDPDLLDGGEAGVEAALDQRTGDDLPTGVDLIDDMPLGDFMTALLEVWRHLVDPTVPAPAQHTAVHEATIYAVYQRLVTGVELELDSADDADALRIRRVVWSAWLASRGNGTGVIDPNDEATLHGPQQVDDDDFGNWEHALDCLADDILWDRDFEMYDDFADATPERADVMYKKGRIDRAYFTSVGGRLPAAELDKRFGEIEQEEAGDTA